VERPTTMVQLRRGAVEYRFDKRGDDTVVVFHGGHARAGLPLGEDVFEQLGCSVLAPSRPGYGMTPLSAGSPEEFAATTAELCAHLGIERLTALMAISAGGRTGLAMAANHPDLVPRLILEVAVGFLPWPDRLTGAGGKVLFNHVSEPAVWALVRTMMRVAPRAGLRAMMRPLSTEPTAAVVGGLSEDERATLVALFARMRSGRGFSTDLEFARQAMKAEIAQPTLVIASRGDRAVPLAQAETLHDDLENAELLVADTTSHLLWFGPGAAEVSDRIQTFLSELPKQ
jgi:pimeloyl-ACP methyl ester carboxylesterase